MNQDYASIIAGRLTMADVLEKYHYIGKRSAENGRGRTTCPLHNGEDNNFCYTNTVFHCWVCGAKGNIIGFVEQLFALNFKQALVRLNYDFGLCLPVGRKPTLREQKQMQENHRNAELERKRRAEAQQEKERIYWELWDEWIRLDKNKTAYAPQSPEETLHPLFVEALQKLSYQKYLIDSYL